MINVSAAMGGQFAFAAAEITAEIERLGPNPLSNTDGNSHTQGDSQKALKPVQVENGNND
jgi:hypothetical protein